jgi:hypothetical protein
MVLYQTSFSLFVYNIYVCIGTLKVFFLAFSLLDNCLIRGSETNPNFANTHNTKSVCTIYICGLGLKRHCDLGSKTCYVVSMIHSPAISRC